MSKVALIGRGYVGQAYKKLFPDAIFYERHEHHKGYDTRNPLVPNNKDEVNKCDLAIVCVPTPMREDGSCDTSILGEVISWLETPLILIKSTIPPGTTRQLKVQYGKRLCHSPEFVGEGGYYVPFWLYPHPTEPQHHSFMIIGGDQADRDAILQHFYPVLGASKTYLQVDETTSELIKYMENCAIAAKVTLCNEFYNLAETFGVSYAQVREGFILDKRLGDMFTCVYEDRRGFDGKCLPKDVNGIINAAGKRGYHADFLKAILAANDKFRESNAK